MVRVLRYDAAGRMVEDRDDRTLEEARADARARLEHAFEAALAAGMPWRGKCLQIDETSQQHLAAAALRAQRGTLPPDFAWRMADNSLLPLTAEEMLAMAEAAMDHVLLLRRRLWEAKARADAAESNAAADAVGF